MNYIASVFTNNSVVLGVDYSNNHECIWTFFPTEEEIVLINLWYDYDIKTWTFSKWERAIELETEQKMKRIPEILEEMWRLKQQKEWLEMMDENTADIDARIIELKKEYISIK